MLPPRRTAGQSGNSALLAFLAHPLAIPAPIDPLGPSDPACPSTYLLWPIN